METVISTTQEFTGIQDWKSPPKAKCTIFPTPAPQLANAKTMPFSSNADSLPSWWLIVFTGVRHVGNILKVHISLYLALLVRAVVRTPLYSLLEL